MAAFGRKGTVREINFGANYLPCALAFSITFIKFETNSFV
jgi:hypothetical protein